jgi:hypothetical protein
MIASNVWEVRLLSPPDEPAYADLVGRAPHSALSHTLLWRDLLESNGLGQPVYWLAYRGGELRGALPAFVRRGAHGAVLNSLPFVQSTGGVIAAAGADSQERAELTGVLGWAVLDWCRAEDVGLACVISSAFGGAEEGWPTPPVFVGRRTVRAIDLTEPPAYNLRVRRSIQKALRCEPVLREAATMTEARIVCDLHVGAMQAIGATPLSWDVIGRLFAVAAPGRLARFVWAEVDGEPAASLVLTWHGSIVDYYCVGSSPRGRAAQAGSWLCDQLIRQARDEGKRWWNWMASPNEHVYEFKRQWGGQDLSYTLQGWAPGGLGAYLALGASRLKELFPGYYVLPYELLKAA